MDMAYNQLLSVLESKRDETYVDKSGTISSILKRGSYQYTMTYASQAIVTMEFPLIENQITGTCFKMTFSTTGVSGLSYTCTLYKDRRNLSSKGGYNYTWGLSDPNKITDQETADKLANQTLYIALSSFQGCLYNCSKLEMKDLGFRSYFTVNTVHTPLSTAGKEPTCTEDGETGETYCSICGAAKNENEKIPATGHTVVEDPAVEPTCTEPGKTAGSHCSKCGEVLEEQKEVPATGHDYTEWEVSKEPTCTEDGEKISVCKKCNDERKEPVSATGHKEEIIPATETTCTEPGLTEGIRCSVCGEVLKRQEKNGEALGHQMITVTDTEATCGTAGSQHVECTVCGYKEEATEIPATGMHQYGEYTVRKEATALAAGIKVRTCGECGAEETVSIAKLTPTIKLNATSITLKVKQSTTKVTVSGLAKGDKVSSWKSSNTKIVTVTGAGKITAQKQAGSAVLTVTLKSGKKATVKVKVQKTDVKTTKISGLSKSITLKVKKKATLKPVISPITSVQKVTYKTSNKAIATVSGNGVITAKKSGKVKITVQSGSKKFVVTVTVKK